MGKKKELKFEIGDWVEFDHVAKLFIEKKLVGHNRLLKRFIERVDIERKVGQIVGAIYRFEGEVTPERITASWEDYYPGYLEVDGSKLVWQVRTGFLNKPYEVFEEDIKLLIIREFAEIAKLPWKDCGWNEYTKKIASDQMKEWYAKNPNEFSRDSKGRFCK